MNPKEKDPDFFHFSILPKEEEEEEPDEATLAHPGSSSNPAARAIEEIVGWNNLSLSLSNPYHELFLRHKAPIVNEDGSVYCAQKRMIVDHVGPINPPSGGGVGGAPVGAGSYSVGATMAAPESPNPNPNPSFSAAVVPPASNYSENFYRWISRDPDQATGSAEEGSERAAKRGRLSVVAVEREEVDEGAPNIVGSVVGIVEDDDDDDDADAEDDGDGDGDDDDVLMMDLTLKLGLP